MKKITKIFKCGTIAFAMFFASNVLIAQTGDNYEISDGGQVTFNAGTYTGTITSTTATNASTALLKTNGSVTLSGTYSDYYGETEPQDGTTLTLNSATFGSFFTVGDASNTSTTTLYVDKSGGVTFSGSGSDAKTNMVTMDKYGVVNIVKDLTLTKGNIQMNSYDNVNAPLIRFYIASTTPKITFSEDGRTIKTDDPTSNRIDASKHLYFDLTNAPQTSVGAQSFTIASFSATGDPTVTGTPSSNVTGNTDNVWDNFSVDVSSHNLRFNASYNPPFQNDWSGYDNNWSALVSDATAGQMQTLLKSYAATSGLTATKSMYVNLQNYNFSGSQTITIASSKTLGFKTSGSGELNNSIEFGDATSQLAIIGSSSILGGSFSVTGATSGQVLIGDGSTSTSFTLGSTEVTKFNSKVSKYVVKANSTLTVNP